LTPRPLTIPVAIPITMTVPIPVSIPVPISVSVPVPTCRRFLVVFGHGDEAAFSVLAFALPATLEHVVAHAARVRRRLVLTRPGDNVMITILAKVSALKKILSKCLARQYCYNAFSEKTDMAKEYYLFATR
jgi:hypothetical protein